MAKKKLDDMRELIGFATRPTQQAGSATPFIPYTENGKLVIYDSRAELKADFYVFGSKLRVHGAPPQEKIEIDFTALIRSGIIPERKVKVEG